MEQISHLQKQIQTSIEEIKVQIQVKEEDQKSLQSANKIIVKYKSRVAQMARLIHNQSKQIQSLKKQLQQFKPLNDQLQSVLRKLHDKQKKQQEESRHSQESKMALKQKQLQNQLKRNSIMKKELDSARHKLQFMQADKIDTLKNQIKQKQRQIAQLNAKIKLMEKMKKQEKNCDGQRREDQLNQQLLRQNQEIVFLKKRNQELKKKEDELQKAIQGSLSVNINKTDTKKSPSKSKQKQQPTIKKQQFDQLTTKLKQLQTAKKLNQKSLKHSIDALTLKLEAAQRQKNQMQSQIYSKQQQSNILKIKLRENQRKKYNTLEPIQPLRCSEQLIHSSNLFSTKKQSKGIAFGQGSYRQFDDSKLLPIQKNYRIKKISISHFEEHILGLTTVYQLFESQIAKQKKNQDITIESFVIASQYANVKTVQYSFAPFQYISNLVLYCFKAIQFLKITTSKGQTIQAGNPKVIPKCKDYVFQIKSHEKPISFLGLIQKKKMGGQTREYLINFGLELKKKQVYLRGKTARNQQQLQRKSFMTRREDDKNKSIHKG